VFSQFSLAREGIDLAVALLYSSGKGTMNIITWTAYWN